MQTILLAILAPLIFALAAALIALALRPKHKPDDVMQQTIGDAPYGDLPHRCFPRFPRGGYAAMDERAPIDAERVS